MRQRATAAEEALEAAEERTEKYRGIIDEANRELAQLKEAQHALSASMELATVESEQIRSQFEGRGFVCLKNGIPLEPGQL